ncbi:MULTISPECIES: FMN-binding glutamate synthase family protein [Acinetobacter]|jgi:glutamate synthase domain-containing protein 2|uniref:FMN-binding glutamate synthase family protein n=1 Tax=Acinetobacter radioresistens TaxID=40216 RepID=A0A2T1J2B1_ACIRA|nr:MULTISPECIES: FMN-binding glutamate synthase family protein [Acinetobacter]EXB32655.1 conserved region in glutamate synthase family protein [Acinetobacter sp. 1461402]MCU4383796.1 FMN-binding glutamate synthase family protein [Acinetobacter radioresistens]MCU4516602.1 FMN-binding glutamate synthase family protein [Acinetobacter radioresistens]MCU4595418.1 FMN-binding glutamate synthase family protein [Acinetobacter radioresistens]NTY98352.1 FMN-binding glutamate synthase family protein [Aci
MASPAQTIRHKLLNTFFSRHSVWFLCILIALGITMLRLFYEPHYIYYFVSDTLLNSVWLITALLSLLGLYDVLQNRHSILKNYPIMGHFRYIFEDFRPEIRQYFIESDHDALPFSRVQRSLVYQRAKNENSDKPFGSILDVYQADYRFITHSLAPCSPADPATFRIQIGNEQCTQPYSASIFNISGMSFGSLSANAILALNQGAKMGNFYHDTGEGSISPYHLENGGDLVWQIASGYFGCRTLDGQFDEGKFAKQAQLEQVKMIELKLSQGAKPGHGGILPKHKISEEIALIRGVSRDRDCISPSTHSAFRTPIQMMHFLQKLRDLSGGKPVGFKLCIGHPWQFMSIVKAMLETKIVPDFIVVDGSEGGTGAAPIEFSDYIGTPLREGLRFVHNTLVGTGLRDQIKIGAAGKIVSAFDIASTFALGADWVNSGRGFMFAIGCIQAQSCHTNQCPVGVATQDRDRQKALHVPTKAERVFNFHKNTLHALADMIAAAGLRHPSELDAHHLAQRINDREIKNYAQLHYFMEENALINNQLQDKENFYYRMWQMASAQKF